MVAGDTLSFKLVFRPLRAAEHSFSLPLSLEGIPASDGLARRLRVPISAAGLKPTLTFVSTEVDFGRKVVSRDPCALKQYQGEFVFRNASDKASPSWRLGVGRLRWGGRGLGSGRGGMYEIEVLMRWPVYGTYAYCGRDGTNPPQLLLWRQRFPTLDTRAVFSSARERTAPPQTFLSAMTALCTRQTAVVRPSPPPNSRPTRSGPVLGDGRRAP